MKLKDARKGLGLGRLRASKMCGMRPPELLRIETGKRVPGLKVAMRIARGLSLDVREIDEFGPAMAEAGDMRAAGLYEDEEFKAAVEAEVERRVALFGGTAQEKADSEEK